VATFHELSVHSTARVGPPTQSHGQGLSVPSDSAGIQERMPLVLRLLRRGGVEDSTCGGGVPAILRDSSKSEKGIHRWWLRIIRSVILGTHQLGSALKVDCIQKAERLEDRLEAVGIQYHSSRNPHPSIQGCPMYRAGVLTCSGTLSPGISCASDGVASAVLIRKSSPTSHCRDVEPMGDNVGSGYLGVFQD